MFRRTMRRALIPVAAAILAALAVASPAHAAGGAPGGSSCPDNIRIGSTVSVYSQTTYYGWAEWRYCRSGYYTNRQWVRLHFTRSVYAYKPELAGGKSWDDGSVSVEHFPLCSGWCTISATTYDMGGWTSPNQHVCTAWSGRTQGDGEVLFFGRYYQRLPSASGYPFCA